MLVSFAAVAQDEEEEEQPFSISGSVDTYFRVNLNTTNDFDEGTTQAPATSFANRPGFSLGMANLIASYEGDKAGFTADLVFGPRGEDAVFASPLNTTANGVPGGSSQIVNQLYAYWNVSDNFTLTLGNFNTFLGYEVISPTGNFNYSTTYMFSYGPFSHSGVKADFSLGEVSMMLGVFNQTDLTEFNPTGEYMAGAQIGFGGAYLNFLFDNDFFQVDLTAGWDLGETFYLGVNATSASDSFYGGALYLQNSFTDDFALGLRGEYWQDEGIGVLSEGESVIDLTLSANYTVGNLTIIPELRLDSFSEDNVIITDATTGDTANSLSSFLLAAVYSF